MRIHWSTAAALGFYMVAAGVATKVYGIGGDKANMLFYWLSAFGLTSAAFFTYLQDKWSKRKELADKAKQAADGVSNAAGRGQAAAQGDGSGGDVDAIIKEAETKLVTAGKDQGLGLVGMPVVFILGDQGSTKTTIVTHSGLEPEHIAGQVMAGNQIAPTRSANFWFAKKAVFVEAGGKLWLDNDGFNKLLKKLTPGKFKSLFGNKPQPARAAVVCVDLERFLQQGASETMAAAGRGLHLRLQEISTQFGISFPVYVLFTRSDKVPFFLDYVRNLEREESSQVVGVTLPMRASKGGVYAEEEGTRLSGMFSELFHSLCDKRIEFLPRENDAEKLPGCYEFPREFMKLQRAVVQFLVDIGRPSQLTTSHFLRGFYFTGVRPVFVQDNAPSPVFQKAENSPFNPASGATTAFKAYNPNPQVPVASAQATSGRKVPQWVFLGHFFNDIVLEDRIAMGASTASSKTSFLQKALLGTAAALALLWTIGMTVSFFNNKALTAEVSDAVDKIKQVNMSPGSVPSMDDLKRLDGLRLKLEQLSLWHREGPPFFYKFFLYVGDDLYPITRQAYFASFNKLLLYDTRYRIILPFLQGLPGKAEPTSDYDAAYHRLRSYILTASEWKRMNAESAYLGPRLTQYWFTGRESTIGEERHKLAEDQFKFYSSELQFGNPFPDKDEADPVDKARRHLSSYGGLDATYARLLAEADKRGKTVNYNGQYPRTSQVIINNKDVRGAFTKEGWDYMQTAFQKKNWEGGEPWVLRPDIYKSTGLSGDIEQQLRTRYTDDFIARWRAYFNNQNTTVIANGAPASARVKLGIHNSDAATMILIGLASRNTNVSGTDAYANKVKEAFKIPQRIVPPGGDFVTAGNKTYLDSLGFLKNSVEDYLAKPSDQGVVGAVEQKRSAARDQATSLANSAGPDTEANLHTTIAQILIKPTEVNIDPLLALKQAGGEFCKQFNIDRKFPFDPGVEPEVSVDELNALLRPNTGKMWQFYQESVQEFLTRGGPGQAFSVKGSAKISRSFVDFFSNLALFSDALYAGGKQDPRLDYSVQLTSIFLKLDNKEADSGSITIDGKVANLKDPAQRFQWNGSRDNSVAFAYSKETRYRRPPPPTIWAIFRFFVQSQFQRQPGGSYLLTYQGKFGKGNEVTAETKFIVDLGGAPAVFDPTFLRGLRCVTP